MLRIINISCIAQNSFYGMFSAKNGKKSLDAIKSLFYRK